MYRIIPAVFILILAISCKTNQYSPINYPHEQLIIGSSGGVTGAIKEYALLGNGQLFRNKGISGEWKMLKDVKGKDARNFFNTAKSLGLDTMKFNHPGNMTYYFIYKKSKKANEVRWGDANFPIPSGIQDFYQKLTTRF
jgi:hypothetical protein